MKKFIIFLCVILIIAGSFFGYYTYSKNTLEDDVKSYLIKDEGIKEKNIEEIKAFYSKSIGDKKILVYVKLKNDNKRYAFYKEKSTGNIKLDSYELNGKIYTP